MSSGSSSPTFSDSLKDGQEKAGTQHVECPEGGTAGWCTVIGAALIQFCGFGYATSFSVYQDYYTRIYLVNESTFAISWIGGMNAFMVTAVSLAGGMLYDRGYFYHLLIIGSLLQSFAMFMLSVTRPGQYYQVRVGLGIAQGLIYVPSIAVISHYFSRRLTLAMSLATAGSSLGFIIHPIMLNNLFNGSIGFENGVRVSAGFVTVLLLAACLLLRAPSGPPKNTTNYLSVGRGIINDTPFCFMIVGLIIFQLSFYYPVFYLQLDFVQHGNPETFSFYSLVILNGAGFIGRLCTGFITLRVSAPVLMIISTGICGVVTLGMIGLSSVPTVVVIGIVYGYFSGIYIALLAPLVALLTSDLSEFGFVGSSLFSAQLKTMSSARLGIGIMLSGFGSLVGGSISGGLLTSHDEWWRPPIFSGAMALAGCILLGIMQFVLTRRDRQEKQLYSRKTKKIFIHLHA